MATNKYAIIRYQALDKCFSNWHKRFDIGALVNSCNEAIYQFTGIEEGVKKRQVYDDINFMESPRDGIFTWRSLKRVEELSIEILKRVIQ